MAASGLGLDRIAQPQEGDEVVAIELVDKDHRIDSGSDPTPLPPQARPAPRG